MIVRKFMHWAATATPAERAAGAGALARAWLYGDMDPADRREAELALTALTDDPAPSVRKALAEAFASDPHAPPSIVLALANDQSEVAAPILQRSPLLADDELIECATIGDAFAQAAIALRVSISPALAAALAEVGGREALIALTINDNAQIPDFSLGRMVERFGHDGEFREAMLGRANLPPQARSALALAAASALNAFVTGCGWISADRMSRVTREACDKANVEILGASERERDWRGARELVAWLRGAGKLTAGVILRSLMSGHAWLFEAATVELSGLPEAKCLAMARDWRGAGFAALFAKSGFPEALLPAFRAALAARWRHRGETPDTRLSRAIIADVLAACRDETHPQARSLLASLRRLDSEAAREEAREAAKFIFAPQNGAPGIAAPDVVVAIDEADFGAAPRLIAIDFGAIEAELAVEVERQAEVLEPVAA